MLWGDEKDVLPIALNGKQFQVTRNLDGFLSQVRSENESKGPYWTDAICTKQKNEQEENAQVAMVRDI